MTNQDTGPAHDAVAGNEASRERDHWVAFAAWAFEDDAWHVATRFADLMGRDGAAGLVGALARAERLATGRQAFALNEARIMLFGALQRRWG